MENENISNENLELTNANIYQFTNSLGVTSDWLIRKNISGDPVCKFDRDLSNKQMFDILKFAQKMELGGYSKGLLEQRKISSAILVKTIKGHEQQIKMARDENLRLSRKLMQLIGDEDDMDE